MCRKAHYKALVYKQRQYILTLKTGTTCGLIIKNITNFKSGRANLSQPDSEEMKRGKKQPEPETVSATVFNNVNLLSAI